jgi:hypothetical protein
MMKLLVCLLLLIVSFAVANPALASICRNINGHQICILDIKRSAKNYWEYRASVSIDDEKKPIEIYNCRDRILIQADGSIVPLASNNPGELICTLLKR